MVGVNGGVEEGMNVVWGVVVGIIWVEVLGEGMERGGIGGSDV